MDLEISRQITDFKDLMATMQDYIRLLQADVLYHFKIRPINGLMLFKLR